MRRTTSGARCCSKLRRSSRARHSSRAKRTSVAGQTRRSPQWAGRRDPPARQGREWRQPRRRSRRDRRAPRATPPRPAVAAPPTGGRADRATQHRPARRSPPISAGWHLPTQDRLDRLGLDPHRWRRRRGGRDAHTARLRRAAADQHDPSGQRGPRLGFVDQPSPPRPSAPAADPQDAVSYRGPAAGRGRRRAASFGIDQQRAGPLGEPHRLDRQAGPHHVACHTISGTRRIGPSGIGGRDQGAETLRGIGKHRYRPDDAVGAPQTWERAGARDRIGVTGKSSPEFAVSSTKPSTAGTQTGPAPAPHRRPLEYRSGPANSMSNAEHGRMTGGNGRDQLGHAAARPGPWTEPGERGTVDIDDDHAGSAGGGAAAAATDDRAPARAAPSRTWPGDRVQAPSSTDEAHQPRKPRTQTAPQRRLRRFTVSADTVIALE